METNHPLDMAPKGWKGHQEAEMLRLSRKGALLKMNMRLHQRNNKYVTYLLNLGDSFVEWLLLGLGIRR